MTRRLLSYAFPFIDSFDPLAQAPDTAAIDDTLQMDEEMFRGFYSRTSGMLWAYVARATGDPAAADDLLQEAYYRILKTRTVFESDDHRRNYLFRIATNLIRDRYRRPRIDNAQLPENGEGDIPAGGDLARQTQQRTDLRRAMAQLSQRERQLVWLAYGQGSTHQEIAGALGLKTGSIKPLLFRARRKLAKILRPTKD
jgi:RNA polymerase sigma-70 factor (ECF subfamily)